MPMHRLAPLRFFTLAALGLASLPASAQWTGRGEAGLVIASGNTDTKAGNVKATVKLTADPWTHEAGFAAVYSSDSTGTTAQRWELSGQTSYQFSTRDYSFGGLRYENDRFSGFEYQGTVSAGVGRKWFDTDVTTFTTQVGIGYKFFETRDTFSPGGLLVEAGDNDSAMAVIGESDFRKSLNASTTIINELTVEYTSESTFAQNELSLQVAMTEKLAVSLGYAVRYNTDPPPAFEKTDTLFTANLVYEVE